MNHPSLRDALEKRIASLERELERVRSEFATFSGRMSHDIQNIFRNIDGFACALQERSSGKLTEKEAHYLQRVVAGARRGDSLMRDVASLSAAAVADLRVQPIDLDAVVDQCIRDLAPNLHGRDVEWERAGGPWPRVAADPALLRIALDHLLGNAVKFTQGRGRARIGISVAAGPEEWSLSVNDNGAGFDLAYADRLFKPFERLHLPTEFEGNGVGLALVKTVVERHGGQVSADAPAQGGAVFTITLRQRGLDFASSEAEQARSDVAASGAARRIRILVVDDDPLVLTTLRLMLERGGHDVVTATGGAAALEILERETRQFDLLIADWLMPQVGGAEVVKALKAAHPSTPVIVLTGQRPDLHGRHEVPSAVDQVLDKPITPAKLRAAVAALVGW